MERLLRTYEHVAQKDHWCDRCCMNIRPDEMYEGRRYTSKNHGIYTLKMHTVPMCDYPEEPDFKDIDTENKNPASPTNIADKVEEKRKAI